MADQDPSGATHTLALGGHTFEIGAERVAKKGRLTLRVDGRVVDRRDAEPLRTQVELEPLDTGLDLDDLDIPKAKVVVLCLRAGRIRRVALLVPPKGMANVPRTGPGGMGPRPERIPFEPPAGSRAYRLWKFQQDHPTLYAVRHVVVATLQVALLILGLSVAVKLPWPHIPLPAFHLPRPDLPSIPLPRIPLPDLPEMHPPGWLVAVLAAKKYWFPILLAIVVAATEVRRRRKRQAAQAA